MTAVAKTRFVTIAAPSLAIDWCYALVPLPPEPEGGQATNCTFGS